MAAEKLVLLTMEAPGPDDIATEVEGPMKCTAEELIEDFQATVRMVASRMGPWSRLEVEEPKVGLEEVFAVARKRNDAQGAKEVRKAKSKIQISESVAQPGALRVRSGMSRML